LQKVQDQIAQMARQGPTLALSQILQLLGKVQGIHLRKTTCPK
jgi:hypothetical protein